MVLRYALMLVAVLLVVGALASLIAPNDLTPAKGGAVLADLSARPDVPVGPAPITARVPQTKPIIVPTGTLVTLKLTAKTDDELDVVALGAKAPVVSGEPTELQVLADVPGKHPITLGYSGKRVGTLEVRAAG